MNSSRQLQPTALDMFDNLYNNRILELAADIPLLGHLKYPQGCSIKRSKLCGSTVSVEIKMTDGKVSEFAHEVKACALGQASSSIMARNVVGATLLELEKALSEVTSMLKNNGPTPQGRFGEAKILSPVKDFKARHASVLLTFEATLEAAKLARDQVEDVKIELCNL